MPVTLNPAHANDAPASPQSAAQPRVLCIDDDPDLQTTVDLRLRDYAVQVEHAFYGMQGVNDALRIQPDLILMDLAMPNGDGQYLLRCLKSHEATMHIPVIVVTGMRDPEIRRRMLAGGASAFLQKPLSFDELLHHMSRWVDVRKRVAAKT